MSISMLDLVIRVALTAGTSILFTIMFLAYLRLRNRKLLYISIGFGIFFAQAVASIPELLLGFQIEENIHLLLHLIVLVFILIGTLKD